LRRDRPDGNKAQNVNEGRVSGNTPLLWGHINPYGLFRLDMNTRLAIELAETVGL
jgi:hypothetical protein